MQDRADTQQVTMAANMSVLEVPSAEMQEWEIYNVHSGARADTVEPWFRKGRTSKKRVSKSNKKKMWNEVIWRHLSNWFGALQTKYKITNVA